MQVLPHQIDQLVGVLARRWHPYSAGPVEVHVAELVGQPLDLVGIEDVLPGDVEDDIVDRGDGALGHGLGDQEKVLELEPEKDKHNREISAYFTNH